MRRVQDDFSHPRDKCGECEELDYAPGSFRAKDDNGINAGRESKIDSLESDCADDYGDYRELKVIEGRHGRRNRPQINTDYTDMKTITVERVDLSVKIRVHLWQ